MINKVLKLLLILAMLFQVSILVPTLLTPHINYAKATFSILLIGLACINYIYLEKAEMLYRLEQEKDEHWQAFLKKISERK